VVRGLSTNRANLTKGESVKAGQKNSGNGKAKAERLEMTQLVVIAAYARTFSTGKRGFFGKVLDPSTGKRYQVIGAVEIAS
jgi:hypothetical protein